MKKWIDDIEKQIEEIKAGNVDAKNLSKVLDKDAPVTLTADLQNNKVKVGLDIDSETLEVNNGKLKVKVGAKKYLHQGICTIGYTIYGVKRTFYGVSYSFINETSTPCSDSDFRTQYSGQKIVLTGGVGFVSGNEYGVFGSMILQDLQYNFGNKANALNLSTLGIVNDYSGGSVTIKDVYDNVTEL